MNSEIQLPPDSPRPEPPARRSWWLVHLAGWLILIYVLVAYVILPQIWTTATRRHPDLTGGPHLTHTADGIPGDPLNVGLTGSEAEVIRAVTAAGWFPADPITFRSSLRIIADTLLKKPDDEAPVSDLYLFGRRQDLAFEQPIGDSPRQRHHVRFWRSDQLDEGRPLWLGSATLDTRVGLSRTTGEVTHHIGPDVDAERDRIVAELRRIGEAQEVYWVDQYQELQGRNGGGDPWHTDGRLAVVVLVAHTNAAAVSHPGSPFAQFPSNTKAP